MKTLRAQLWARNLSKRLENSYDSSALLEHKITIGGSREAQVLDILKVILPQKYPVLKNIVIVNSDDEQTAKFDGGVVDIQNWPVLFSEDDLIVSPVESVKVVFEIKSNLGKTEISRIYDEAKDVNEKCKGSPKENPSVVGFSYKCGNIKLTYYDFKIARTVFVIP